MSHPRSRWKPDGSPKTTLPASLFRAAPGGICRPPRPLESPPPGWQLDGDLPRQRRDRRLSCRTPNYSWPTSRLSLFPPGRSCTAGPSQSSNAWAAAVLVRSCATDPFSNMPRLDGRDVDLSSPTRLGLLFALLEWVMLVSSVVLPLLIIEKIAWVDARTLLIMAGLADGLANFGKPDGVQLLDFVLAL